MAWLPFEHEMWTLLKQLGLENKEKFLLAVSGGLDSMALLEAMLTLKPKANFSVLYYHHGPSESSEQVVFRDRCYEVVRNRCAQHSAAEIKFISEKSQKELSTESEMREARWDFIRRYQGCNQLILTAHHLDDWVETLTLKLIRGVGPEGFAAFKLWDGRILRPFLEVRKETLHSYAQEKKIQWIEDPTNSSTHYLRNWLRHEWFKTLDEKNPSGYENYSRSLLRLVQALDQDDPFEVQYYNNMVQGGIDRNWYLSLSSKQQMQALVSFLRHHGIRDITQGKIAEIQKRLDKNQKELTFIIGNTNWVINEKQIMLAF